MYIYYIYECICANMYTLYYIVSMNLQHFEVIIFMFIYSLTMIRWEKTCKIYGKNSEKLLGPVQCSLKIGHEKSIKRFVVAISYHVILCDHTIYSINRWIIWGKNRPSCV